MKAVRTLDSVDFRHKRVFVRVDFNVPLKNQDGVLVVGDSKRIEAALPTIHYLLEKEAKVILASHLGRPEGKVNAKYSLEPVGVELSRLLDRDVVLTESCIGDGARGVIYQMRPGQVVLLENLRFAEGEEDNSPDFCARLAELCEAYVGDAFGTVHRAHASTAGLPKLLRDRAAGFLIEHELQFLQPLRDEPTRPFVLAMGGSKVSDKMGILEHFMDKLDVVLVGGAMAYAFLKAAGYKIGESYCDYKQVELATKILKGADARGVKVILPKDHRVARRLDDVAGSKLTEGPDIAEGWMGVDIGPKTVAAFAEAAQSAETLFWNGPMGVFETPEFAVGTFALASQFAACKAKKLAGGGDVASALAKSGFATAFDFISTGGGATLEYLEGKELPGLKALEV